MINETVGWSDELITGNTIIDTQHRHLFAILEKMESDINVDYIEPILKELIHYTQTHFREEESLMMEHRYPEHAHHQALHRKLEEDVLAMQLLATDKKLSNFVRIQRFLRQWLRTHILEHDLAFVQFLRS